MRKELVSEVSHGSVQISDEELKTLVISLF